ncbi:MAG: polyprenyl synthetase family protein [Vicinamibacterales bacterium]
MTGVEPLGAYLDARRAEIEAALLSWLPGPPDTPAVVANAMRYSVEAGGKRLRPILCLAAAESVAPAGGRDPVRARRAALPAACAIEMIHTYSLVHDDLPAMDNDTLRRGRATLHVVAGEGMAILAGDGLLTEAFLLLARGDADAGDDAAPAAHRLRAIEVIAAAAGSAGMVGGQALDLDALPGPGRPAGTAFSPEALREMHARKTGALIAASAVAGAVMAGASAGAEAAVREAGRQFGLAFQIVDDILDVEGTTEALGKTAGKDAAAGKPTYPALFGIGESRRLAQACIAQADAALRREHLEHSRLAGIGRWIVERVN